MDGKDKIGEVRGVGESQNIEECMMPIIAKKLDEFPDKEQYLKKVHDMEYLTKIDQKVKDNLELTKEELEFLYEIKNEIEGFGYEQDPRIEEIKKRRNIKKDYAVIFDCKEENIGTELADFDDENKKIIYYIGDLEYEGKTVPTSFRHLKCISGHAVFKSLTSTKGLENLQTVGRSLFLNSLTSAKGLENLQIVGMSAWLNSLISAEGLENLQTVGGSLFLNSLTSAKGLENLQTVGGYVRFDSLTSAKGLENLQIVGMSACLNSLISAEGLENLQTVGWDLHLDSLTSAKGLENLQTVGWNLYLDSLTSAEGLENLRTVNGEDATKLKEEINRRNRNIHR